MASSTSSSEWNAPDLQGIETPGSRGIHLAWLLRVVGLSILLLGLTAVAGSAFFVRPVYDPDLFVLPDTCRTLIVGASHAATNIEPEYLVDAVNVGRNGEPVFFTYYKLRALLDRSPNVDHVVFALSVNHVSSSQDRLVFAGDARTRESYMAYFPFLGRDGRRYLHPWSEDYLLASAKHDLGVPLGYMDDLRLLIAYYRDRVYLGSYICWGGFEPVPDRDRVDPAVIDAKIRFYFYEGGAVGEPSELAMEHVRKAAALCEERSIRLTFVSTPLHERFRAAVPESCIRAFEALMADVLARYPGVRHFDESRRFTGEPVFFDGDHLGRSGTTRFSRALGRELRTLD